METSMTLPVPSEQDLLSLQANASKAAGLLKVLSNAQRLMLLCQLCGGERCVSELEALTGIRQPTLSQQLTVLREEAMVSTRREGKQIFYSVSSDPAIAVLQVLYQQYCGVVDKTEEAK